MSQQPTDSRTDLLDTVAGLLAHVADDRSEANPDRDRARFCHDVGDWIRSVRTEMSRLCSDFENGMERDEVVRSAASAVQRLAGETNSLADRVREALTAHPEPSDEPTNELAHAEPSDALHKPASVPSAESSDTEEISVPSHVESAAATRSRVAEFRERLRAERAEKSRLTAEARKRFVNSIRSRGIAGSDDIGCGTEPSTDIFDVTPIMPTVDSDNHALCPDSEQSTNAHEDETFRDVQDQPQKGDSAPEVLGEAVAPELTDTATEEDASSEHRSGISDLQVYLEFSPHHTLISSPDWQTRDNTLSAPIQNISLSDSTDELYLAAKHIDTTPALPSFAKRTDIARPGSPALTERAYPKVPVGSSPFRRTDSTNVL